MEGSISSRVIAPPWVMAQNHSREFGKTRRAEKARTALFTLASRFADVHFKIKRVTFSFFCRFRKLLPSTDFSDQLVQVPARRWQRGGVQRRPHPLLRGEGSVPRVWHCGAELPLAVRDGRTHPVLHPAAHQLARHDLVCCG